MHSGKKKIKFYLESLAVLKYLKFSAYLDFVYIFT